MQAVEHANPLTAAVRRALATAMPFEGPDEELLHRFVQSRDEYAFHAIVRRHGGMVLSVCRYVLRNDADADDAFQATFLLLASKANNVRNPAALSGWLYEVAGRTAGKALTSRNRRRSHEASAPKPERSDHPDFETQAIIHEELRALPDRYRVPLVLHHLDGRTQDDTARALGISKSGVKKRLDQAREALRNRLTHRGLAPTAFLVAPAALAGKEFTAQTSALAVGYAAGALPAGALSAAVLALVQQGTPIMIWTKIAACGLLLVGGTLGLAAMGGKPDEKQAKQDPTAPKAKVEAKADTNEWKLKTTLELDGWLPSSVAYSSDGKLLAVGASEGKLIVHETDKYAKLWDATHGKNKLAVAFSPYSEMVAITQPEGALLLGARDGKVVPESAKLLTEKGDAPEAIAFLPDKPLDEVEKGLVDRRLVFSNARQTTVKSWMKWPNVSTITVNAVAKDKQPADDFAFPLAIDPAGRCVVMTGPIDPKTGKNVLWAHVAGDYSKGSPGNRIMEGHKAPVVCAAWSANGKTVATGDTDGTVILWDGATLKEKGKFGFDRRVCAVALNADSSRIAAAIIANDQVQGAGIGNYHELVYVWDPKEKPDRFGYLKSPDDKPQLQPFAGTASLAFSPDGKQLASAFFNQASLLGPKKPQGKVLIWELNKPEASKGSKELEGEWKAVGMEEAGKTLAKNEFEGLRFTFKDGKLDVSDYSRPGNKPRELMLLRDSKFVANAEAQPRTLDLHMDFHKGVTIKGIYRIRDGELKMALRTVAAWELPRPTGYSTISSKLVSITLEKVKPGEESAERKAVDLKLKQVFVVKDNLSVRPSAVSPNGPVIHFFKGQANEAKVSPGETALVDMPKRTKVVSWVIPGYDPEGLGDDEGPEFDYVLCKWERNGQVTFTAMRKP